MKDPEIGISEGIICEISSRADVTINNQLLHILNIVGLLDSCHLLPTQEKKIRILQARNVNMYSDLIKSKTSSACSH